MTTENVNKLVSQSIFNHTAIKLRPTPCNEPRIVNFSVNSDSVVAKAVVLTDKDTHFVEVDWGDGETSRINVRFAKNFKLASFDGDNALQPGTYEFYHRYDVTYVEHIHAEGVMLPAPMDYTVSCKTIDFNGQIDLSFQDLRIEPKYEINFYQLTVGLKNQCDNGSLNEFSITQMEGGVMSKDWDWFPSDNFFFPFPTYRIPNSQVSQVYTVNNSEMPWHTFVPKITFSFVEHDDWYDDKGTLGYDNYLSYFITGQQESASGKFEGDITIIDNNPWWQSSCGLMYEVDWEIRLLAPMPVSQPLVFTPN